METSCGGSLPTTGHGSGRASGIRGMDQVSIELSFVTKEEYSNIVAEREECTADNEAALQSQRWLKLR